MYLVQGTTLKSLNFISGAFI